MNLFCLLLASLAGAMTSIAVVDHWPGGLVAFWVGLTILDIGCFLHYDRE